MKQVLVMFPVYVTIPRMTVYYTSFYVIIYPVRVAMEWARRSPSTKRPNLGFPFRPMGWTEANFLAQQLNGSGVGL